MTRNTVSLALFAVIWSVITLWSHQTTQAQASGGDWTDFVNVSNTRTASTYPCITGDAAGNVHVLWSEDVGGSTWNLQYNPDGSPALDVKGNQINRLTNDGNALFYTRWDGDKWLDPIDVQVNPSGYVQYPQAVVDHNGILHVIWVATGGSQARLSYSQVLAGKAESAHEWSEPTVLAESVLFAYYPADIAADLTGGIHVIYAQTGTEPGAYVTNSFDGGQTWSAPIELYPSPDAHGTQEGVAPMRLVADRNGRLHATWTEFGTGGNGKAIYYSQSLDLGRTWSQPIRVAAWQPGWYEVDWLSAGVVGDEIHLVWEGSSDVAALNERISTDGGLTWNEPHQILPKLVGENGFEDLVVDSANQLHMVFVQRGDPASLAQGVWYTSWNRDLWRDPILLGTSIDNLYSIVDQLSPSELWDLTRGTFTGGGLRYTKATIVNGNRLFVVVVNERDGDIWSSHTTLAAPYISPQPYPQPAVTPTPTPVFTPQPTPTQTSTPLLSSKETVENLVTSVGDPLLVGSLPVLLLVGIAICIGIIRRAHN